MISLPSVNLTRTGHRFDYRLLYPLQIVKNYVPSLSTYFPISRIGALVSFPEVPAPPPRPPEGLPRFPPPPRGPPRPCITVSWPVGSSID